MKRRAVIHQLNSYSYCIDDAGDACCYVVCGQNKAAVIDTVNGMEDLRQVVREITDLPLTVINTHGHCDHIYGNTFFEEAYIHPDDVALHNAHFAMKRDTPMEMAARHGATAEEFDWYRSALPCPLHPIAEGAVIDLGGVKLEVIRVKGHTQGSIALLDRASGYFYSGDAVNKGQCWLQLDESTSLPEYLRSLEALAPFRPYIKEIHGGHSVPGYAPEFIDMMADAVREVLAAHGEGDGTISWFAGDADAHRLKDGSFLLYAKERL